VKKLSYGSAGPVSPIPPARRSNAKKAFITLTEGTSNTLIDGGSYSDTDAKGTIFSNDDLEIKGAGRGGWR
jgi:hypothetical protein